MLAEIYIFEEINEKFTTRRNSIEPVLVEEAKTNFRYTYLMGYLLSQLYISATIGCKSLPFSVIEYSTFKGIC